MCCSSGGQQEHPKFKVRHLQTACFYNAVEKREKKKQQQQNNYCYYKQPTLKWARYLAHKKRRETFES